MIFFTRQKHKIYFSFQERERLKQLQKQLEKQERINTQLQQQPNPSTSHYEPDYVNSPRKYHESPRRQGYLMPLPTHSPSGSSGHHSRSSSDNLIDSFNHCTVSELELGIPVDEVDERRIQEEKDAVR